MNIPVLLLRIDKKMEDRTVVPKVKGIVRKLRICYISHYPFYVL